MQDALSKQDAWEVVKTACAKVNGTLKDHELIQTALRILTEPSVDVKKEEISKRKKE